MSKIAIGAVLLLVGGVQGSGATAAAPDSTNPVVEWNRTLLTMVRTPGVQPGTVHPTRSFAILHAATVIVTLLWLPFGKLFHVFQRPAQLGVKLYHQVGDAGEPARCARCGERFASRLHVDDLKLALSDLGFDYRLEGPAGSWQELCPACKRKSLAAAQLRLKAGARGEAAHG